MEKIGTYKLIAGNRVRLNKRAQEILGLEEKGDRFKAYHKYDRLIKKGVIVLAPYNAEMGSVYNFVGERKMYDDGTARWANIPKAMRDELWIKRGYSLDMFVHIIAEGTELECSTIVLINRGNYNGRSKNILGYG